MKHLPEQDAQVFKAIQLERKRQQDKIELIASENFCKRSSHGSAGLCLNKQICRRLPW